MLLLGGFLLQHVGGVGFGTSPTYRSSVSVCLRVCVRLCVVSGNVMLTQTELADSCCLLLMRGGGEGRLACGRV